MNPTPLRRLASSLFLSLSVTFGACGGGGGGGGPPQLALGVDLSGAWTLTQTVTTVSGNSCTDTVGEVSVAGFVMAHVRANNRLTLDPGTVDEVVGSMNGVNASFAKRLTIGTAQVTGELQLTFSVDGQSCTGTSRSTTVNGADNCTVTNRVTGVRATAGTLVIDVTTTGVAPLASTFEVVLDGGAPQSVSANGTLPLASVPSGAHMVELLTPAGQGYLVTNGAVQVVNVVSGQGTDVVFTVERPTSAVAWVPLQSDFADATGNGHDGAAFGMIPFGTGAPRSMAAVASNWRTPATST